MTFTPCPFCDYSNVVFSWYASAGRVSVECQECGAQGPTATGERKAKALWNDRSHTP